MHITSSKWEVTYSRKVRYHWFIGGTIIKNVETGEMRATNTFSARGLASGTLDNFNHYCSEQFQSGYYIKSV